MYGVTRAGCVLPPREIETGFSLEIRQKKRRPTSSMSERRLHVKEIIWTKAGPDLRQCPHNHQKVMPGHANDPNADGIKPYRTTPYLTTSTRVPHMPWRSTSR